MNAEHFKNRDAESRGNKAIRETEGVPPPAAKRRRPSPGVAVRCTAAHFLSQLAAGGFAAAAGEGRTLREGPRMAWTRMQEVQKQTHCDVIEYAKTNPPLDIAEQCAEARQTS
jgi:hypothetical protein